MVPTTWRLRLAPIWVRRLLTTRRCRGDEPGRTCPQPGPGDFHTHHLTAFGRWLYS